MHLRDDEGRDPTDWLVELEGERSAFERLVLDSGSLALAAWRVARARCGRDATAPTTRAICTVAREIAERTGCFDVLPSRSAIALECERFGLAVTPSLS